jgi:hypothetical protein
MQKKRVPIYYGLGKPDPAAPSIATTQRLFPHAEESVSGGCVVESKTVTEIYVCPECKKAEAEWIRNHRVRR